MMRLHALFFQMAHQRCDSDGTQLVHPCSIRR
jgi:hypothetical protein